MLDWIRRKLKSAFTAKVETCARYGTMYYGDGGTIHGTRALDVEVHNGKVVAVWFRCMPLPFVESQADDCRACEMERLYRECPRPGLVGVDMERTEKE